MAGHQDLGQWRGRELLDRDGDRIGKLEDVYVDVETDEPEFGTVKEGIFGKHLTFVPLRDVTIGPDHLQLAVSKEQVKDAPNLDSDAELSVEAEADLYRHFDVPYTSPVAPGGRRLGRR